MLDVTVLKLSGLISEHFWVTSVTAYHISSTEGLLGNHYTNCRVQKLPSHTKELKGEDNSTSTYVFYYAL
jgi:hypothetical protein